MDVHHASTLWLILLSLLSLCFFSKLWSHPFLSWSISFPCAHAYFFQCIQPWIPPPSFRFPSFLHLHDLTLTGFCPNPLHPVIEWTVSHDHFSLLPLLFPPPLFLYLARRTSFPPWVLQTPVWELKVEGEEKEERLPTIKASESLPLTLRPTMESSPKL